MKRILFFPLLLLLCAFAFADRDADIKAVQAQIDADVAKRADFGKRVAALEQRQAELKSASEAWERQSAELDKEVAAYKAKFDSITQGYKLLDPMLNSYNQRVAAHNAHQCTEKCVNGSCDGSCAWYTAEKTQLDADKQSLEQAYAPLDKQKAELTAALKPELDRLIKTGESLDQTRSNLDADIATWKDALAKLKAEYNANEAEISKLQARLSELKKATK